MDGAAAIGVRDGRHLLQQSCCSACRSPRSRSATRRCRRCRSVLVFNSLLLWTLATVSVEWARHREFSSDGQFGGRCIGVDPQSDRRRASSPGQRYGFSGLALPGFIDQHARADESRPPSRCRWWRSAWDSPLSAHNRTGGWAAALAVVKLVAPSAGRLRAGAAARAAAARDWRRSSCWRRCRSAPTCA